MDSKKYGLQSMSKFVRDRANGDNGEDRVVELYKACGWGCDKVDPKDKDVRRYYDIETVTAPLVFTTEVKYDLYATRSGNIAIETWNPKSNRPSGLSITRADFWCHVLQDSVWLTPVEELRRFVDETPPLRTIEKGGDGNATILLFQRDVILPRAFVRIDDISPKKLRELVWKHFK